MDIEQTRLVLENNITPIRDSLMVPAGDSYGCVAGSDMTMKNFLDEEEITEEHVVIKEGTRIGRKQAGIISTMGIFEVRIRRPARVSVIAIQNASAKKTFSFNKKKSISFHKLKESGHMNSLLNGIPAMLDYSISEMKFEIPLNCACPRDEKDLCREIKKGLGCSDLVITVGGLGDGDNDPTDAVLEKMGARNLFRNAGNGQDALNAAYIMEKKVILCLSSDPEGAMRDFDDLFGCCAAKLMSCDELMTE